MSDIHLALLLSLSKAVLISEAWPDQMTLDTLGIILDMGSANEKWHNIVCNSSTDWLRPYPELSLIHETVWLCDAC